MSIYASSETILNLAAASAGGNGTAFDLSGFGAGAFWVVTTLHGGGWTPTLQASPDGTNWVTPATSEIANFAAAGSDGLVQRYPYLLPTMMLGYVRVTYTIVSGSVTAQVIFRGRGG